MSKKPVLINRYANRKLYDSAISEYIKLTDLTRRIAEKEAFIVYDRSDPSKYVDVDAIMKWKAMTQSGIIYLLLRDGKLDDFLQKLMDAAPEIIRRFDQDYTAKDLDTNMTCIFNHEFLKRKADETLIARKQRKPLVVKHPEIIKAEKEAEAKEVLLTSGNGSGI